MPLKILHVLSSTFYAGSVAYVIKIAEKQAEEGCEVILLSDTPNLSPKLHCIALPISNRKAGQRVRNIRAIQSIIKEHNINIVHAHSRAASWVSCYAVRGTKIPLVSTIHGRQVKKGALHKSDIYGDKVIVVCPNLYDHLINEISINPAKMIKIPNGIDIDKLNSIRRKRDADEEKRISVIGRFNGPKGENFGKFFMHIFPRLLAELPNTKVQLYGSEWESLSDEAKQAYASLELKFKERIQYFGFSADIFQDMANSDLVIGAGRVALESALLKVPVFAMGEACVHGLLTPENITQAIDSNFGDILAEKTDFIFEPDKVLSELKTFLSEKKSVDISGYLMEYNVSNVVAQVMNVYRTAIMQKACSHFIPVLMYHKVPLAPLNTQHRIFVTKANFEKHLRFFRFRKLTSITFKEYYEYSNGDLPVKNFPKRPFIISFDDGYADNHENALPRMKKYGFKGVLFLLGDFAALANFWDKGEDEHSGRLMGIEQKQEFLNAGWEIGAHTMSHCDLTKQSLKEAFEEVSASKSSLEEALNTEVCTFAYPYGFYNDSVKSIVERAGFKFGIATDTGGMSIEDDHFAVFRINMFPEESYFQLFKKTSSWYRKYYKKKRGK